MRRLINLQIHIYVAVLLIELSSYVLSSTVYLGCYETSNQFFRLEFESNEMTPYMCSSYCRANTLSKVYHFGVANGNSCYCSDENYNKVQQSDFACDSPCSGDRNQICGGTNYMSLYKRFNSSEIEEEQYWELLVNRGHLTPKKRAGTSTIIIPGRIILIGGYTFACANTSNNNNNNDGNGNSSGEDDYLPTEGGGNGGHANAIVRFNDVWSFCLYNRTWNLLHDGSGNSRNVPSRRSSHSIIHSPYSNSLVIFGGYTGESMASDQVWSFQLDTLKWTMLHPGKSTGKAPGGAGPGDENGVMTNDDNVDEGVDKGGYSTEISMRNHGYGEKTNNPKPNVFESPLPRGDHSAIYYKGGMYIFGGSSGSIFYNDVWEFELDSKIWIQINDGHKITHSPLPREAHSVVLKDDWMIIIMGRGPPTFDQCFRNKIFRDVWRFNLESRYWEALNLGTHPWDGVNDRWASETPSPRHSHVSASIKNDIIITFGGAGENGALQDLWAFNMRSNSWERLLMSHKPENRSSCSISETIDGFIVFGGEYSTDLYYNDIWRWTYGDNLYPGKSYGRGSSGLYLGIALLTLWLGLFLLILCIYCPKKRNVFVRYAVEKQNIVDMKVFKIDKKVLMKEKEMRKELEQSQSAQHLMIDSDQIKLSMNNVNRFDQIPDELVMKIFDYLRGHEMARVGLACSRFYQLASDHIWWKELCNQHWEEANTSPKELYKDKFTLFRQKKQEAEIFKRLVLFRTTVPFYIVLFLISMLVFLSGLKLDGYLTWSWRKLFFPLWIIDLFMLSLSFFLLSYWGTKNKIYKRAFCRVFPTMSHPLATPFIVIASICMVVFTVLIVLKLDEVSPFAYLNWWCICAPLLVLNFLVMTPPIYMIVTRGWKWSYFWGIFFGGSYLFTLCLIIARTSGHIHGDWCLLFLPWWISDVFALVLCISMCMELHSTQTGWILTLLYSGYLSCSITFRSLLCVNLGSVCGDPVTYSYNLIFIIVHIFVIFFGVPFILLLRHRIQTPTKT